MLNWLYTLIFRYSYCFDDNYSIVHATLFKPIFLLKNALLYIKVGLLFVLCPTDLLWAQNPHLLHFTVDDGLPSSFVYRTFQDSKGYIWVCSDMGIARFNGYNFETFTTKEGLPYNDIWDFSEDSKGRIWLHTYLPRFAYFDYADQKIHVIDHKYKYINSNLLGFHEWQGDVWASTNSRTLVNMRTGNEFVTKSYIWSLNGHTTSTLLYLQGQTIYNAQQQIVHVLQKDMGKVYNAMTQKNSFDKCWNAENRFVYSYNDTIFVDTPEFCAAQSIKNYTNTPNNSLVRVDIISDDKLLLVTQKEFFVLNQHLEHLKAYDFLQHYDVNTVFEDRERNLWITTKNNGLYMLTQGALNNHLFVPTSSKQVRSVVANTEGNIFFASSDGYIHYIANNKLHTLPLGTPFWGHVRQIAITPHNLLIVACNNHTLFISLSDLHLPKKYVQIDATDLFKTNRFPQPRPNEVVYWNLGSKKILNDAPNRFFLSNSQTIYLISECDNNRFCLETIFNGYRNYAFLKDTVGNLFIGTHTGIRMLQNGQLDTLSTYYPNRSPLKTCVNDMAADPTGNFWVATNGSGIYYLTPQQQQQLLEGDSTAYTLIEGVGSSTIKSVFIDSKGIVWAAGNQGIYQIELPLHNNNPPLIRQWSLTQGLPSNETFSIYASDSMLSIGTSSGLTQINRFILPEATAIKENPPLLYFTDFGINKVKQPLPLGDKNTTWSYLENNIDISYVCLSYQSNRQITYYYRMIKNADENALWQTTSTLRREFPLASPANYRFELKARDISGNETPIQHLSFTILPPWWQQTWFRVLATISIITLLWLSYVLRLRFVRRQERLLQEFATMRLQMLQSQMNPHFMNNALNAIQLFIARSDNFSANEYLAKFAMLNRLYLEAARQRLIPLSQELQLLQTYLDLETLRFPNRFSYSIDVLPELIAELKLFPAMLLQPLAENAINHGILYLQSPGTLNISIVKQDKTILCSIEDNGIGRKAANAIKAKMKKTHISRGMQILEELQNTINMQKNMQIDIKIIDKTDDKGNAKGTIVKISLQYLS